MAFRIFRVRRNNATSDDPFHSRVLLKDVLLLIIGFALGLLGNWVFVEITTERKIAYVTFDEGNVTAFNRFGEPLWCNRQTEGIRDATLWTSPNSSEQMVVAVTEECDRSAKQLDTERSGRVIAYNKDGTIRWTKTLSSPCPYNTPERTFTGFNAHNVLTTTCKGEPCAIVLFGHYLWFPAVIEQLRLSDGDTLGSYWNPGTCGTIALVHDHHSKKEYVLWANLPNNDLAVKSPGFVGQRPSGVHLFPLTYLLFDPDFIHGEAPTRILGTDTCVNVSGSGTELWLAFLQWGEASSNVAPRVMVEYDAYTHRTRLKFLTLNDADTLDLLTPTDNVHRRVFKRRVTLTPTQWKELQRANKDA